MDDREILKSAEKEIKLPEQSKDKTGWVVRCKENNRWKAYDFKLQEDAWGFYYSKLSELKPALMKTQLTRQKGA